MKKEKSELEKDLDYYKRKSEWFSKIIAKYQEENKKLKEGAKLYRDDCKKLREENKKLKKYYDRDKEELMESCYGLAKENEKLKEEVKWWKDLVHKAKEFEYDEDGMDYIYQNTENL